MKKVRKTGLLLVVMSFSLFLMFISCRIKPKMNSEQKLMEFIIKWEEKARPLYKERNLAYFRSQITGDSLDYKKSADLEIQWNKLFTNKEEFSFLKEIRESGEISDSLLKRQLDVLYNMFLAKQVDEKKLEMLVNMQNEIERKFSTFRAVIGKDTFSDNDVEEILRTSTDQEKLKLVWEEHKKIGAVVAEDVIKLVKLRNEIATELGFKNYHEMSLMLLEQNPDEVLALFNELDELTRDAFMKEKDKIDAYLAKRNQISTSKLMPWHYQNRFFQEAPGMYPVDLDVNYKDKDLVAITSEYYRGLGLEIDDMVKNSDLYEDKKNKPAKNQHAFCIDIDNAGDVRVLCNVKSNSYWMNTMLHEFGHAVYDKYISMDLPFLLREPAHIFTTEAIAQMFGRFASNPVWMSDVLGISAAETRKISEASFNTLRLEQLVFSRWSQVMYRFEKSLYENPDQDLNKLWWDLVEKYQMMKRPAGRNAPDWASKVHIATTPCYYHNYLMGELLASQLYNYICKDVLKSDQKDLSFKNRIEVGEFLKENVFSPGMRFPWNEMIERATGEKLTAKYYANQFLK